MQTVEYIQKLTAIPSPTGYTHKVIQYVNETLQSFGYDPQITPKGGLVVTVKGENDKQQRFVTAHVDTLGAMVRAIKPNGRLKIDLIGGFGYSSIEGENCLIHLSGSEKTISGTILMHQTSVHVYKDARTQVTDLGFIKSRHLDDKVSAAILMNQLRQIKEESLTLPFTTHFAFSTFEEVGHGMNSNIPSDVVEYLAVDMGAMGDDQQTDEYSVSICVKDGSGPYNFDFRQHLVQLCKDNAIDYKLDIYPYYASDASAALSAGAEVKHALFGAGIESSHAYERTHIESVQATEQLVHAYLFSPLV